MNQSPLWARRWLLGVLLVVWASYAVFAAGFAYLHHHILDKPIVWSHLLFVSAADCLVLLLLTWMIVELNGRFPFAKGRWVLPLLIHVVALVVGSLIRSLITVPAYQLLTQQVEKQLAFEEWFKVLFTAQFPSFALIYWLILGAILALNYYQKYREREVRTTQLEAQLAQAQLQMLKMQLHPHFLFNTLNAIAALMHQDVELADRMIARLGELLRSTLENAGTQHVTLQQELDFIKPYLEIEQARLGPRLAVRFDIDPETMDAQVPNLLLQPLVENAIRHGIAPRAEPGMIEISARRDGATLTLAVRDNGPGLNGASKNGKKGIGLQNTQARLQQLYGLQHRFEIANDPDGGLRATIELPFQETPAQPRTDDYAHATHPHRG